MTLVDTSIWINFLRNRESRLRALLAAGHALLHPFVLGELMLGTVTAGVARDFLELPTAPLASDREVRRLIEVRHLSGSGIGYVDAHLIASALMAGASLLTEDLRLRAITDELAITYQAPPSTSA